MYGEDVTTGKSIYGSVWLKENLVPKLAIARVSYSKSNVEKAFEDFKTSSAIIEGKVGYELSPSTILVYNYQERYIDANNDGKIQSNKFETRKTVSMGVEFKF